MAKQKASKVVYLREMLDLVEQCGFKLPITFTYFCSDPGCCNRSDPTIKPAYHLRIPVLSGQNFVRMRFEQPLELLIFLKNHYKREQRRKKYR